MALHCTVGKSKAPDGITAGRQAAQACAGALLQKPDVLLLFCSPQYHPQHALQGIRDIFPETAILGCSSAAEIHSTGSDEHSVVLGAIAGVQLRMGVGGDIQKDPFRAGKVLGEKLAGPAGRIALIFSDGLAGDGGAVVRGIQAGLAHPMPLVGGAAGDEFVFQKTFQYFNEQVLEQTVLGAVLEGDFEFGVGVRHGWEPVGLPVKVTRSSGPRLMEVNGSPAVKFYEEYFGEYFDPQGQQPFGRLGILYPLGMAIPESPEYLLRAPFSVDSDGSVNYAADLPEGADVRLMIGSAEGGIRAARIAAMEALSQMRGKLPQLALVFNCIARRKMFGRRAEEELATIRDIIGERVPMLGFYTFGEIAPVEGIVTNPVFFHNETVVIMLLG